MGGGGADVVRVAIVGNSFTGALNKAIQQNLVNVDGYELSFLIAGRLERISIQNGRFFGMADLANMPPVHPVGEYDFLFIYGRLPTPYEVCRMYKSLVVEGFSSQVVEQTISDYITGSETWETYSRFRRSTDIPIFTLSANIPSKGDYSGRVKYEKGIALIRDVIGDAYHEFPVDLFNSDWAPRIEFYKNSVNKWGERSAPELSQWHDLYHMNEYGGALVLKSILDRAAAARLNGN